MKKSYKYKIVFEEEWYFKLYPNNSDTNCVGISSGYNSYDEAIQGLRRFKDFFADKCEVNYDIIDKIASCQTKKYSGIFVFSNKNETFRTRFYEQRYEVKSGIKRILNNYDSHIKTQQEK